MSLFRTKIILHGDDRPVEHRMARTLGWPSLVALGVGAIVGTGILTLIGVGADRAGPAVLLSFVIAGAICACAALCYAEMATMIPASGSAYTYSYAVLGEVFAWVVGWSLILEYSLVVASVAVGWSGYAVGFLGGLGIVVPPALANGPALGGVVNLPAVGIIAVVAGLLLLGTRESARVNTALVVLKIVTLTLFVFVALPHFDSANLQPFAPFGYGSTPGADGAKYGVMGAAAIIFFAFYGFDAISTAAEEAKNPERDLAIGIVGSMVACTVIYLVVAAAAVGAIGFTRFSDSTEPLALILRELGQPTIATVVAAAAAIALPTVLLAFLYGQSRIFLVMARDGFLPKSLATIDSRGTPTRITIVTAAFVAVIAGLVPLDVIASLANAGTLCAFVAVAACVLVLRRRSPEARRPFRTPAVWVIAPAAILGCVYLFTSLQGVTQTAFFIWNGVGLAIYFAFGRARSLVA
ncbi:MULTISPECIES: amino acid permease [unclassified Sphingomonas]|uniref:amino acid permease n=1 Tax=unclassified Sphingomonas TaxID=196159 RepID=UPI000BC52F86|nr:MAG: amino acid permease [Sphingomonas sp. 12-62-6]OYX37260.1 MAG: amino acid permease [Sphingomonas sp. 32-62-10]OYY64864.1 MAG: amino acid permease [Sphingomonas sp. 28-62-11]